MYFELQKRKYYFVYTSLFFRFSSDVITIKLPLKYH